MKLSRTTLIVSLMVVGLLVCWGTNTPCRSVLKSVKCLSYYLKKMEPSFKGKAVPKAASIRGEAHPCAKATRKVFVNWRRLYWGNLGELTKPERFFEPRVQATEAGYGEPGHESLRYFTQELRAALRAFEKKHGVKILWYKTDAAIPDLTDAFIGFWDKGFKETVIKK